MDAPTIVGVIVASVLLATALLLIARKLST
jgi:hypothetical protein